MFVGFKSGFVGFCRVLSGFFQGFVVFVGFFQVGFWFKNFRQRSLCWQKNRAKEDSKEGDKRILSNLHGQSLLCF